MAKQSQTTPIDDQMGPTHAPFYKRGRFWRRLLLLLLIIVLIPPLGLTIWSSTSSLGPDDVAQQAIESDEQVTVVLSRSGILFWPTKFSHQSARLGFIFYPGGLVEPEAYASHLRPLAEAGIAVFVPRMPLNFAVFDPNEAAHIIEAHPDIQQWAIGGHSLGGAMAAQFAADPSHQNQIDGLVLWAAYPAESTDLSPASVEVLSIYGSRDGLIEEGVIDDSASRLPADTRFVEIVGGNHAQFGRYGPQNRDNTADISVDVQQQEVVSETLVFLQGLVSGR